METQKNKGRGLATKEVEKAIVQYRGTPITITFDDVKRYICPLATDQEVVIFLRTAQSLQLNPFAKEIYLIKYGEGDKAAMVIAIDSYLKSAEANNNFNGFEAGIILRDSGGKLEFREGSLLLPDEAEKLVGGWSRVYRRDREKPFYIAVNKAECLRYTKDGNLTRFWAKEKQPSMLRKTGLKRALVEAFPSLFTGTLSNVEADYEVMPEDVSEVAPKPRGETPEGQLPPALEKGGKPDWKKYWARVKSELELTTEQARELLQVDSIKKELIDAGWTMERIWDQLVIALRLQKATEVKTEQVVDVQTGEIVSPEEALFGEGKEKAGITAPTEAETKQPTGAVPPAKPQRDPETIRTINELYKACNADWGMQPKAVLKELGISSQNDISDTPANCYRQLLAVRR